MNMTNYEVTIRMCDATKIPNKLRDELEDIGFCPYGDIYCAKRYSSEVFTEFLVKLSLAFPTALFDLYAEEDCALENAVTSHTYIQKGKVQVCPGEVEIRFPAYDPAKMIPFRTK